MVPFLRGELGGMMLAGMLWPGHAAWLLPRLPLPRAHGGKLCCAKACACCYLSTIAPVPCPSPPAYHPTHPLGSVVIMRAEGMPRIKRLCLSVSNSCAFLWRVAGEGASGEVFQSVWRGQKVAVKIFQVELTG